MTCSGYTLMRIICQIAKQDGPGFATIEREEFAYGEEIDFFSMNLDTGKSCRFPDEFTACYAALPEVVAAYAQLPEELRRVGHWPR
jgi:hypothetical protein